MRYSKWKKKEFTSSAWDDATHHRSSPCITQIKCTGIESNPQQNGQIMENSSCFHSAWKILNPSEAIGKYSKFNYVFRLCFIAAHHLINTAHLGIHQGKYCKLVVSTKCCHISNRNCPLPSIKYSPTLAGVTGSYKYLWKCIWLLIWELLRLLLFFFLVWWCLVS